MSSAVAKGAGGERPPSIFCRYRKENRRTNYFWPLPDFWSWLPPWCHVTHLQWVQCCIILFNVSKLAINESVLSEHDIQTNIHLSFICGAVFSQEIAVVNSVVNMSQLTLIVIFYVQKGTLSYILLFKVHLFLKLHDVQLTQFEFDSTCSWFSSWTQLSSAECANNWVNWR